MEINLCYTFVGIYFFHLDILMLNCLVNDVRSRKFDAEAPTIRFRHIKFINYFTVILEIENVTFTLSFIQIGCLRVGIYFFTVRCNSK